MAIFYFFEKIKLFFNRQVFYSLLSDKNSFVFKARKWFSSPEVLFILETSPENIKEITVKYGTHTYSTKNKKIRKLDDRFVPFNFGSVAWLYEKDRDEDIWIYMIDKNDDRYSRNIPKEDKTRLKGWYKELEITFGDDYKRND